MKEKSKKVKEIGQLTERKKQKNEGDWQAYRKKKSKKMKEISRLNKRKQQVTEEDWSVIP